jgi:hypothetical protein
MPYKDYDRYAILNSDGSKMQMPFVNIPISPSDKYETWNSEFSRMDKLSQKYYGNPFYDFLIMYANGEFLSEFDIPDGVIIRIPFPLAKVNALYEGIVSQIKKE